VYDLRTLAGERSPEKAGGGGSIPSLATTFSIAYKARFGIFIPFHSKTWRAAIRLVLMLEYRRSGCPLGFAAWSQPFNQERGNV
jgi:hypothetical protein